MAWHTPKKLLLPCITVWCRLRGRRGWWRGYSTLSFRNPRKCAVKQDHNILIKCEFLQQKIYLYINCVTQIDFRNYKIASWCCAPRTYREGPHKQSYEWKPQKEMTASLQRAAIGHREEALSGSCGIRTLPARINHQNQYIWDPGHETSRLMSKLLLFCAHFSYLAAQLEYQFQKTDSLFPGRGRGVGGGGRTGCGLATLSSDSLESSLLPWTGECWTRRLWRMRRWFQGHLVQDQLDQGQTSLCNRK